MTQADGSYCPIHRECGTMLRNLSDRERRKLLREGHIMRYCDSCRRPWLLTVSEEEKVALARIPH
jgi:hypothetical protein